MKVKLILCEDVKGVGREGDIIDAARGYAENFLLPKKMAIKATPAELARLEIKKTKELKLEESRREELTKIKEQLDGQEFVITAKAGENGKLFGSITAKEIAEIIKASGLEIDKKKLVPEQPIKNLGVFTVTAHLLHDVEARFEVKVEQKIDAEREEP